MRYISIDIETTGLDPLDNQMIEFAAVLEDTKNIRPIDELPKLRLLIKHELYTISQYCLTLHTNLYKELGENPNAICPEMLYGIFTNWLLDNNYNEKKVLVAGKNFNVFDLKFINEYTRGRIKFHHRTLDPATLFVRPDDIEPPSLKECAERAGIDFKGTGYHTALSDATMVVELLRAGWNLNGGKK